MRRRTYCIAQKGGESAVVYTANWFDKTRSAAVVCTAAQCADVWVGYRIIVGELAWVDSLERWTLGALLRRGHCC